MIEDINQERYIFFSFSSMRCRKYFPAKYNGLIHKTVLIHNSCKFVKPYCLTNYTMHNIHIFMQNCKYQKCLHSKFIKAFSNCLKNRRKSNTRSLVYFSFFNFLNKKNDMLKPIQSCGITVFFASIYFQMYIIVTRTARSGVIDGGTFDVSMRASMRCYNGVMYRPHRNLSTATI